MEDQRFGADSAAAFPHIARMKWVQMGFYVLLFIAGTVLSSVAFKYAADASGVRMLQQFARTLEEHRDGILAYYDYRISTGPLEGINNKIRTLQRQAYGFRDLAFFKLKILSLHQSKFALVG